MQSLFIVNVFCTLCIRRLLFRSFWKITSPILVIILAVPHIYILVILQTHISTNM